MAFNKLFSYAEADIPRRSGHDEFHRHAFSLTPGTLTPTFWDFVVPGDIVSVAPKFHLQLPPQATDFIGRINLRTELFYVPIRTIWAGFKDFICYPSDGIGGPAPDDPAFHAKYLPGAKISAVFKPFYYKSKNPLPVLDFELAKQKIADQISDLSTYFVLKGEDGDYSDTYSFNVPALGACSLMDYLGFKVSDIPFDAQTYKILLVTNFGGISAADPDTLADSIFNNEFTYVYFDNLENTPVISSEVPSYQYGYFKIWIDRDTHLVFEFVPPTNIVPSSDLIINNITIPFTYHKIFNDWYMDKRIMKPLLPNALTDSPAQMLQNIAYMPKYGGGFNKKYYEGDNLKFYDGKSVFDLRQRLWQKDYFTTMTTQPQAGDAASVTFDTTGDTGEFTIASLRVANAMQLWRERMNMVDPTYGDAIFAHYGVYPDDSVTGKAIYLGSSTQEVYNKSVYQQGDFSGSTNNPINSVGSKYASPMAVGGESLCNDYHIREHGIIMAITSLVPEAMYSSGTRRQFHYDTIDDIAFPLLQGVGDQPVYAREIIDTFSGEGDKSVIGYQQRYTEYRFINDNVSGLLRDGQSLQAFALQRSFTEVPELGASFLEIPKEYLDQVSAVGIENSKFGAWVASAWNYRKASRFSALSSMPTLGHMKNTETITLPKAGKRL